MHRSAFTITAFSAPRKKLGLCGRPGPTGDGFVSLLADDRTATPPRNLLFEYRLGPRYLYVEEGGSLLFTDNVVRDNGGPGVREIYHPSYYGAFVLDPDGHNVEAVCHLRQPG